MSEALFTPWDEVVEKTIKKYKPPSRRRSSPDVEDRRAAARARNRRRGAAPTGGPGKREIEAATKPSPSVSALQQKLRRAGYDVMVDGIMGPETQGALDRFNQALNRPQAIRASEDLAKPAKTKDTEQLLGRYGFVGASTVRKTRQETAKQQRLQAQWKSWARSGNLTRLETVTPEQRKAFDEHAEMFATLKRSGIDPTEKDLMARIGDVWLASARETIDPRNWDKVAGDIKDIVVGTGKLLGAGWYAAMHDSLIGLVAQGIYNYARHGELDVDFMSDDIAKEVFWGTVNDLKARYGDNWRQYVEEDPLFGVIDAAGVVSGVARLGSIGAGVARGASLRGAVRQSYRPEGMRLIAHSDVGVGAFRKGRSPLQRLTQRVYDSYSVRAPDVVPGSAFKRVAKQTGRRVVQEHQAREAQLAPARGLVSRPGGLIRTLGARLDARAEPTRTALFWEGHVPEGTPLERVQEWLRERWDEPLDVPELEPTDLTVLRRKDVVDLQKQFDKLDAERREVLARTSRLEPLLSRARSLRGRARSATDEPTFRPRTETEALERLATLDDRYDTFVNTIVREVIFSGDEQAMKQYNQAAQRLKNMRNAPGKRAAERARTRAELEMVGPERSVLDSNRNQALEWFGRYADANPDDPNVQRILENLDEREELRNLVNEAAIPEEGVAPAAPYGEVEIPAEITAIEQQMDVVAERIRSTLENLDRPLSQRELTTYAEWAQASRNRIGGALSVAKDKLERAEQREALRQDRRTLGGQQRILERLQVQRNRATPGTERYETLGRRMEQTQKRIARMEQMQHLENQRPHLADKQYELLSEAISVGKGKRYQAALEAAAQLTEMQEEAILRLMYNPDDFKSVVEYEQAVANQRAIFSDRRAIISRLMEIEGMPPAFYTHQLVLPERVGVPGGVRGKEKIIDLDWGNTTVNKKNELRRVLGAQVLADSRVLVQSSQKISGMELANSINQMLLDLPSLKPIPVGSAPSYPNPLILKKRGRFQPEDWQLLERDDLEYGPWLAEEFDKTMKELVDARGGEWLGERDVAMHDGLYEIPMEAATAILRQMGGKTARRMLGYEGKGLQTLDIAMNFAKLAVMYTKPGYYVANLLGNMTFLGLAYDPITGIVNLARAGAIHRRDPAIWNRLSVEMGEGPSSALMTETFGTGGREKVLAGQRAAAQWAGWVDRGPRVAAWMHEAAQEGVKTDAEMRALLDSDSQGALEKRERIRERAKESMVNFDAMSPLERDAVRRIIFVYPWLRGSVKWTKDFALGRTERAALLASLAEGTNTAAEEKWKKMIGYVPDLPSWLEQTYPVGMEGGYPSVVGGASLNPMGTVTDILKYGEAFRHPRRDISKYGAVAESFNPATQAVALLAFGMSPYGNKVPLSEAAQEVGKTMVPGWSTIAQMAGQDVSKVYVDRGPLDAPLRQGARVKSFRIDLEQAANRAISEGTAVSTPGVRVRREVGKERQEVFAALRQRGPIPASYRLAYQRKADLDAAVADLDAKLEEGDSTAKQQRLELDLRMLLKWGLIPREAYVSWVKQTRGVTGTGWNVLRGKVSAAMTKVLHDPINKLHAASGYDPDAKKDEG